MNSKLRAINGILSVCDAMIEEINRDGILRTGNRNYEEYKSRIRSFMKSEGLDGADYGPYIALSALYFGHRNTSYTVNQSEATAIKRIVASLKRDLFSGSCERIFISHREKDKEQVEALVELIHTIGIPRPTINDDKKIVFCTSHPAAYIDNGKRNLDTIRNQFEGNDHVYFILWYSDSYFESQACLNEAGAIWASNSMYQEILAAGFDSSKIGGLLDKQPVWFHADDKYRLNTFKSQLEATFCLDPLEQNAWEVARDAFISRIA